MIEPRISLKPINGVGIINANPMPEGILNISKSDMALLVDNSLGWPEAGASYLGRICIGSDEFDFAATVRYRGPKSVELKFKDEHDRLSWAIARHLDLEILAMGLCPIKREFLKRDSEGEPHWYTDSSRNELYFVLKDDCLFQLSWS